MEFEWPFPGWKVTDKFVDDFKKNRCTIKNIKRLLDGEGFTEKVPGSDHLLTYFDSQFRVTVSPTQGRLISVMRIKTS